MKRIGEKWSRQLTGDIPEGKQVFYQKQMTHHLLPEIDRSWFATVTNCFLIRDPREVIVSYLKKNNDPTVEDIGYCPAERRSSIASVGRRERSRR